MTTAKVITTNKERRLFVITDTNSVSCLGFDVCFNRLNALAKELDYTVQSKRKGSIKMYNELEALYKVAHIKHLNTGWVSKSELIPEFIGKEGKRVEVITSYGTTERYYIGKSIGFIPCHLEIKKSNSTGGTPVTGYPFKSIRFIY